VRICHCEPFFGEAVPAVQGLDCFTIDPRKSAFIRGPVAARLPFDLSHTHVI
jgi:hypothetical protein